MVVVDVYKEDANLYIKPPDLSIYMDSTAGYMLALLHSPSILVCTSMNYLVTSYLKVPSTPQHEARNK
jgi:hypothetical protein